MDAHSAATVLVVGDDPGVVRSQRDRLERAGYRVVTAQAAPDALAALRRGRVDLLVLDHRAGGGRTGLDLLEQFRAEGFRPPVILAGPFDDAAVRALRAGVRPDRRRRAIPPGRLRPEPQRPPAPARARH